MKTEQRLINPTRQFHTEEEIKRALTPGTIYYRVYWGTVCGPRKVVRIEKTDMSDNVIHTTDFKHNGQLVEMDDFIGDMQNDPGKGVFTNKEMAEAFYVPRSMQDVIADEYD